MAQRKKQKKPTARPVTLDAEPEKPAKIYVSSKISLGSLEKKFHRADLVFEGLDHSGVSYEARVFLNNATANHKTPLTPQNGYAGVFHIFGHGGCFGDVGHCEVRGVPRPFDPRPSHPLTPARKVVIATDAIRRALARGKQITVTIVPLVLAGTARCDYENVVKFDKISVFTYV